MKLSTDIHGKPLRTLSLPERNVLLCCLSLLTIGTAVAETPPSALEKAWIKIETPTEYTHSRDIISFILEAARTPGYQQRNAQIEAAFRSLERMQDRDPLSKTYGNFCWYWREQKPGEPNGVEFIVEQAALLKLRYAKNLSPKAQESLDRMLALALEGIHRHKVDVTYTNIYLMKTWNLLALGEALMSPELVAEGNSMLDQWIDFTSKNGISEYISPTYYGTDLDSLGLMARQLSNPQIQEKAQRILRLYWSNIAANWFEPAGRLGGAHGRDYDYLTGHGALDHQLNDAGWIDPKQAILTDFHIGADSRWVPPDEIHQKALGGIPRFVFQKWGAPDTAWASQYIGHHFSIGVAGDSNGPEDKPFALNLAGPAGPQTVMVNFFMDGRGDPYGNKKVPTGGSGIKKSHHLVPLFRAVQSGAEVLFVSSWPPENHPTYKKEAHPLCLLSHLDIPIEAVAWTADKALDVSQQPISLPGNICFFRMGDVAVGVRFLLAIDTTGHPVPAQLLNDGTAWNAKRLTVTHSQGAAGESRGIVAVAIRVQEGLDDAGFTAFRSNFLSSKTIAINEGNVVRLSTEGLKGPLALNVDLSTGQVLSSEGADRSMQIAPMSVNGAEYCKGLLNGQPVVGF